MQTQDKEDKIILSRAEELMQRCVDSNVITYTDFLDLRMQGIVNDAIKYSPCRHFSDGGYADAERCRIVFLPDWASEENYAQDCPNEILRVCIKKGGRQLGHRDYLGAMLGLGISRAKTGDIIVRRDGADIIIDKSMEEFLLANFFKAGRTELSLSVVPISEINMSEIRTETVTDTLASLRLDAFLASAYRTSRSRAQEAISQGIVFLNHAECRKSDAPIRDGDVVSVRGKGKCILEEIGKTSKKDRTFITIKKFI